VLDPRTLVLPVGGITLDNMAAYRSAGAQGFGIGSSLYRPGASAAEVGLGAVRWATAFRGLM
jgi:2-dehydro-3-deoxyphosphogalactonate aldolase